MARPTEKTRAETLAAALAILDRSSTARALSMDALAAELGTSKSTAYRWFDSRDQLIVALVSDACEYAEASIAMATRILEEGGCDTDDADVACILRDLVANLPGALLETRGGKRDQVQTAARDRMDRCFDAVLVWLREVYPTAFALSLYAAVSTAPSTLGMDRPTALASALDLVASVLAREPAPTAAVPGSAYDYSCDCSDPDCEFHAIAGHPTWRFVTAGAAKTVHVTSNAGEHGRTLCNERRPFALTDAHGPATCRKCAAFLN